MSSTKLQDQGHEKSRGEVGLTTYPLQLMNEPIAPASRHEKPIIFPATTQPPNLPQNDSAMIAKVNPQVMPMLRK